MLPNYSPETNPVKIAEFARDMAIYGADDMEGVLAAHNLTPEQALAIVEHSVYKTEYARVEAQLSDPHGALRIKAQNMLPLHIDIMGQIAADKMQPAASRLKAIDMVCKVAGVGDDTANKGSGVIVNLSFGGLIPTPSQPLPVVEVVDAPALGTTWELEGSE